MASLRAALKSARHVKAQLDNKICFRICGEHVHKFLQGLVTGDITAIDDGGTIFTALLNHKGRVFCDAFLSRYSDKEEYLLHVDKEMYSPLEAHLGLYTLRKKVEVELAESLSLWWLVSNNQERLSDLVANQPSGALAFLDPRLKQLGVRVVLPASETLYAPDFEPVDLDSLTTLRRSLGVPEGVVDLPPAKFFPLHCNLDWLNGVSFDKGCYLGQEITARARTQGVIRRRLSPVRLSPFTGSQGEEPQSPKLFCAPSADDPVLGRLLDFSANPTFAPEAKVTANDQATQGALFGASHNIGIAMLRNEAIRLPRDDMTVEAESGDRFLVEPIVPWWWQKRFGAMPP